MSDMTNISWPGWEVVRKIGSGSFGAVYEIRRDVFGEVERAALKVISIPQSPSDIEELLNEGYDEASVTERFRSYLQDIAREYSLMAKMKGHTNVVYCDDIRYVQHDDGIGWTIYIKMELLTPMMTTLSGNISEQTAIRVGKDLCSALILCKQHNIVHRDIKPQNIFVSDNGEYKLGDFGIAKTAEKTAGGTKIGTYKYMAPEVYNNQPYGAASDIYSLGLVMYWLLNHRRTPFLPLPPQTPTAGVEDEARRRRFTGEPIPAPANGSPALKAIVLKACAFNPRDRYSSPNEMLADLEALGTAAAPQPVFTAPAAPAMHDVGSATVAPFQRMPAVDSADATVGMFASAPAYVPPAAPAAPVSTAKPAAPAWNPDNTYRQAAAAAYREEATVGAFDRVPVQQEDATIGTFSAPPAAPRPNVQGAPARQQAAYQSAPVHTQPAAPAPIRPAPAAEPKAEKKPTPEKKQPKTEDTGKKKPLGLIIGIAAAVVALLVVALIFLLPGGGDDPAGGGATVNQGEGNQPGSDSLGGTPIDPALSGFDVFGGLRFPEMVWGYYEATNYEYNGSKDDSAPFREEMEYITVPTGNGDFEFAVLPLSFTGGKYAHFMGSFTYEGEYYEPYTEKGKTMFRKAYIAEVGDMSEEEFKNIEELMNLNALELQVVDRYGGTYFVTLAYKVENGKLAIYDMAVAENYKVTLSDEPLLQYDILHEGGELTLQCNGVQRSYVGSGYKVDDPNFMISGFTVSENERYADIAGLSFFQYGRDKEGTPYVFLANGDSPIDPVMTFDYDTGAFTLSWQESWTTYNGSTVKKEDVRSISGNIVACTNYGFKDYSGFFLIVDGKCYKYLISDKEYDEIVYGDVLGDDIPVEDLNQSQMDDIIATKKSILEALQEAFNAAGIEADIDFVSGRINLEASFLFDVNSAELSEEGKVYLSKFVDAYCSVVMSDEYSGYISSILVEGHTDTSGSYSLNQTLSEQRAASVANHCIGRNSAIESLIQTKGCSYDYPIYNQDGSVNMDKSRRVTFRFLLAVE